MSKTKYIGLDVHQGSISVAVLDESGKLVMQSVIATRAAAILEFLDGLRGTLEVTFEEGMSAEPNSSHRRVIECLRLLCRRSAWVRG